MYFNTWKKSFKEGNCKCNSPDVERGRGNAQLGAGGPGCRACVGPTEGPGGTLWQSHRARPLFITVLSGSFYHGWGDIKGTEIFGRLSESHFLHMFNSHMPSKVTHSFLLVPYLFIYFWQTLIDKPPCNLYSPKQNEVDITHRFWYGLGAWRWASDVTLSSFPPRENKGSRGWINWYLNVLHYQTPIFCVSKI